MSVIQIALLIEPADSTEGPPCKHQFSHASMYSLPTTLSTLSFLITPTRPRPAPQIAPCRSSLPPLSSVTLPCHRPVQTFLPPRLPTQRHQPAPGSSLPPIFSLCSPPQLSCPFHASSHHHSMCPHDLIFAVSMKHSPLPPHLSTRRYLTASVRKYTENERGLHEYLKHSMSVFSYFVCFMSNSKIYEITVS